MSFLHSSDYFVFADCGNYLTTYSLTMIIFAFTDKYGILCRVEKMEKDIKFLPEVGDLVAYAYKDYRVFKRVFDPVVDNIEIHCVLELTE